MENKQAPVMAPLQSCEAIFAALPPLDSPEYRSLLETASATELPASVLARAYRQLMQAGAVSVANATLERLVASSHSEVYLKAVRSLARKYLPRGQYVDDEEDLFQETIIEIVKTLPTATGAWAESNWVVFCQRRFLDTWDKRYGKKGKKISIQGQRVGVTVDSESGDERNPMDVPDDSAPWHIAMRESKLPWLEGFVQRTVAGFKDPLIRQVAEDQFGPDPSPISAGISATGKPPLTEQLGVDRFRISRALKHARERLFAALRNQKEHELDLAWLQKLYRGK